MTIITKGMGAIIKKFSKERNLLKNTFAAQYFRTLFYENTMYMNCKQF